MTQIQRPSETDAIERVQALDDDPVTVHAVTYVYETEYAHVYLVTKTQQYEGNEQLHIRYAALSKPDAYQMDQWKKGGMSIRMTGNMATILPAMVARACNEGRSPDQAALKPLYEEVENETN